MYVSLEYSCMMQMLSYCCYFKTIISLASYLCLRVFTVCCITIQNFTEERNTEFCKLNKFCNFIWPGSQILIFPTVQVWQSNNTWWHIFAYILCMGAAMPYPACWSWLPELVQSPVWHSAAPAGCLGREKVATIPSLGTHTFAHSCKATDWLSMRQFPMFLWQKSKGWIQTYLQLNATHR